MVIPELTPRSKVLVAVKVAPPVNTMDRTAPPVIVAAPAGVLIVAVVVLFGSSAIGALSVPENANGFVIVVVVLTGNCTVLGADICSALKVFAPVNCMPPSEVLAANDKML